MAPQQSISKRKKHRVKAEKDPNRVAQPRRHHSGTSASRAKNEKLLEEALEIKKTDHNECDVAQSVTSESTAPANTFSPRSMQDSLPSRNGVESQLGPHTPIAPKHGEANISNSDEANDIDDATVGDRLATSFDSTLDNIYSMNWPSTEEASTAGPLYNSRLNKSCRFLLLCVKALVPVAKKLGGMIHVTGNSARVWLPILGKGVVVSITGTPRFFRDVSIEGRIRLGNGQMLVPGIFNLGEGPEFDIEKVLDDTPDIPRTNKKPKLFSVHSRVPRKCDTYEMLDYEDDDHIGSITKKSKTPRGVMVAPTIGKRKVEELRDCEESEITTVTKKCKTPLGVIVHPMTGKRKIGAVGEVENSVITTHTKKRKTLLDEVVASVPGKRKPTSTEERRHGT